MEYKLLGGLAHGRKIHIPRGSYSLRLRSLGEGDNWEEQEYVRQAVRHYWAQQSVVILYTEHYAYVHGEIDQYPDEITWGDVWVLGCIPNQANYTFDINNNELQVLIRRAEIEYERLNFNGGRKLDRGGFFAMVQEKIDACCEISVENRKRLARSLRAAARKPGGLD